MATPHDGRRRGWVSKSDAVELLEEQQASGLTIAAFARKHDIPAWKLYEARRGRPRRRPSTDLIEVHVSDATTEAPSPLELVVDDRHVIRVPDGFDDASLSRLLGVLRC